MSSISNAITSAAESEIVDRAEIVPAQTPLPVEQQKRRRALQLVSFHRLGQLFTVRLVERDGDRDAVLSQIRFDLFSGVCSANRSKGMCRPKTATPRSHRRRRAAASPAQAELLRARQPSCQIATTTTFPFSALSVRFLSEFSQRCAMISGGRSGLNSEGNP